jgi:hypothetical protein
MIRNCSLDEISDGRLYSENDMVKADTHNCENCHAVCCHGMGESIILDPFDVYRLTHVLGKSFEALLTDKLELHMVDGLIQPNLMMTDEHCVFLDENQRCTIHQARPGFCRLFPLGRYWESAADFKYILQTGQCHKDNLSKIKVKKWLDTPDLAQYNRFIVQWHEFKSRLYKEQQTLDEGQLRVLTMYVLRAFFVTPYDERDFYIQFDERLKKAEKDLAMD